jgi:hypothetical protein
MIDVEGSDIVSTALITLLNRFPGLGDRKIAFSTLSESSGIGFFPISGAMLLSNMESITGHVRQKCAYPFNIVYRAALKTEKQKIRVKEFLDTLGRWLEQQTVEFNDETYTLLAYPDLEKGRKIKNIVRSTPAYLERAYQDSVEDWTIRLTLSYEADYYK